MKITVVAQRFPFPLDRGDPLTIFHLVKHFSARHQISLVTFTEPNYNPDWVKKLKPFCERIETVPIRKWRICANSLAGLPTRTPLQLHYFSDPTMRRTVHQVIQETQPDLLYAHYIRMGQYIEPYRECVRVLAMQLSMTLNYRRLADHAPNLLRKILYTNEHRRLRGFEAEFARRFDKVLLISKNDLKAMEPKSPLNNVFFNPHGVDNSHFAPDVRVQKKPNMVIFTGNMNYMPNVDATVYYCREILPLVRRYVPDVNLNIVGADPVPAVQSLAEDPSVQVLGRVPNLRPYINQAQIAIAPMRIAAGLLNKVLEGMSMGLPMVISSIANEGIQAVDGKHVLIADKAEDFANKIVHLLNEPERRKQLGAAARDFIVKEWSWEKHFQDLEQMFCDLVAQSPHSVERQASRPPKRSANLAATG